MGIGCVRKSKDLLEASDWKIEKVTASGDTIKSTTRTKLGKIYRLTVELFEIWFTKRCVVILNFICIYRLE